MLSYQLDYFSEAEELTSAVFSQLIVSDDVQRKRAKVRRLYAEGGKKACAKA